MIAGRCVVSRRPRLSSLNYTELLLAVFRGVVSPFEADAEIRDRSVMKKDRPLGSHP